MPWRFALLVILASRVWACSCSGNWPSVKVAWQQAPFVFLGTVESADPDEDPRQTMFQNQLVHIRVDEAFKGVSSGQAIELHQGATDCDAKFRTGERAVFYLFQDRTTGRWRVPWCWHALGNADPGGDDLLFLRGLPKSAIGTRLSGQVELYEESPTEAFKRISGVPDVRVKVSGPKGFTQDVTTNAAGAYQLSGLAPGRYSVSIQVPHGLKIYFPVVTGSPPVKGNEAAVELAANGGVSVGFVLEADTRLAGRMLDPKGAPLTGVCIDLEPLESRGQNGARFFDCSKKSGGFAMERMPPGNYRVVARDEVTLDGFKSKSTLYYPGVRDRERATTITIEAGKYIEHLDMRLPSEEKRYKISGRLQFSDGSPAPDGTVTFTSGQHGYSETTSTRPDGSFALPVIVGMEGLLNAQLAVPELFLRSCPEFEVGSHGSGLFRIMDANPISLSSNSDQDVTLELPSPSCKSWPPRRK